MKRFQKFSPNLQRGFLKKKLMKLNKPVLLSFWYMTPLFQYLKQAYSLEKISDYPANLYKFSDQKTDFYLLSINCSGSMHMHNLMLELADMGAEKFLLSGSAAYLVEKNEMLSETLTETFIVPENIYLAQNHFLDFSLSSDKERSYSNTQHSKISNDSGNLQGRIFSTNAWCSWSQYSFAEKDYLSALQKGCKITDMESYAFFFILNKLKLSGNALFYISDYYHDDGWHKMPFQRKNHFWEHYLKNILILLKTL